MKLLKDILLFSGVLLLGFVIVLSTRYLYDLSQRQPAVVEKDLSQHFVGVNDKVVLYTTQWCDYCKNTKAFLTKNSIAFKEHDIENTEEAILQRYKNLGYTGVPKVLIGNSLVNGFYPDEIMELLKQQNIMQ